MRNTINISSVLPLLAGLALTAASTMSYADSLAPADASGPNEPITAVDTAVAKQVRTIPVTVLNQPSEPVPVAPVRISKRPVKCVTVRSGSGTFPLDCESTAGYFTHVPVGYAVMITGAAMETADHTPESARYMVYYGNVSSGYRYADLQVGSLMGTLPEGIIRDYPSAPAAVVLGGTELSVSVSTTSVSRWQLTVTGFMLNEADLPFALD